MMQRKTVTRAELDDWLTQEIQKVEDCEGSRMSAQYLLAEPDAEGCNWSGVTLHVGPKTTGEQLQRAAERIVGQARALFNLTE